MNDEKAVIARIPNPNAGPPFYTTASEVATMEFVRTVLEIPVPIVYDWSATAENAVGAEYIIMEEAPGTQLGDSWDGLDGKSQLAIMRELVLLETKLLSVSFSHYGNLYFSDHALKSSVPATIRGSLPSDPKERVSKRFVIGPAVDRSFWNKERREMDIDRGPWRTPREYAEALGKQEIAWIGSYAIPKAPDDPIIESVAQNSPGAHIELLERYLKVAQHIVDVDEDLVSSNLWHADLHASNLFVGDRRITSIIDWQDVWAGPLLLQAQPSELIEYRGTMLLKRPENFADLDEDQKTKIKEQISKSILQQLYLMETTEKNPRLSELYGLDHGKTRRTAVSFAKNIWDKDIVAFREALINVERYWKELGISGECPIHFTDDDLTRHLQDAEGWNELQDFFDGIQSLVQRDGWTANETYEDALAMFVELGESGLKNLEDEERELFEKQTRWADERKRTFAKQEEEKEEEKEEEEGA